MATIRRQLLIPFAFLVAGYGAAAQTTITSDDFPPGTELRNQYAAKGVHFGGETTFTATPTHSGKNVLYSVSRAVEAFSWPGPIRMDFDGGQSSVSLFAGTAVKVTFKSLGLFGPMRDHVMATRRTPEITKFGEMKPRNESVPFGFDGWLFVFWTCSGGAC
jgi:hypothetical protein